MKIVVMFILYLSLCSMGEDEIFGPDDNEKSLSLNEMKKLLSSSLLEKDVYCVVIGELNKDLSVGSNYTTVSHEDLNSLRKSFNSLKVSHINIAKEEKRAFQIFSLSSTKPTPKHSIRLMYLVKNKLVFYSGDTKYETSTIDKKILKALNSG